MVVIVVESLENWVSFEGGYDAASDTMSVSELLGFRHTKFLGW
jgi:hypothetical protein